MSYLKKKDNVNEIKIITSSRLFEELGDTSRDLEGTNDTFSSLCIISISFCFPSSKRERSSLALKCVRATNLKKIVSRLNILK